MLFFKALKRQIYKISSLQHCSIYAWGNEKNLKASLTSHYKMVVVALVTVTADLLSKTHWYFHKLLSLFLSKHSSFNLFFEPWLIKLVLDKLKMDSNISIKEFNFAIGNWYVLEKDHAWFLVHNEEQRQLNLQHQLWAQFKDTSRKHFNN